MTTQTYYPEIKETLKGCNFYVGKLCCGEYYNKEWAKQSVSIKTDFYNTLCLCPVCKGISQTHLSHAEADLIEVKESIVEYKILLSKINRVSVCVLKDLKEKEHWKYVIELIEKKQLRKLQIEENIKLLKESLK